jgi:hypothetical protein
VSFEELEAPRWWQWRCPRLTPRWGHSLTRRLATSFFLVLAAFVSSVFDAADGSMSGEGDGGGTQRGPA